MKTLGYITLIFALTLVSCKTKKKIGKTVPQTAVTRNYQPTDLVASISKGACYGRCPVYTAEIYGDGRVVFTGEQNVTNIGKFEGEISETQLQDLVKKAKAFNYTNLKDSYDNEYVTDLPTTKTYMFIDGKKKSIKSRYDSPAELVTFEKYLHTLVTGLTYKEVK